MSAVYPRMSGCAIVTWMSSVGRSLRATPCLQLFLRKLGMPVREVCRGSGGEMPSKEQIKETVERLRSQLVPSESEVQNLYQKAVDTGYWKSFLPGMGVLDLQSLDHLEGAAFSSEQEAWALAHLARHGYFQLPPLAA